MNDTLLAQIAPIVAQFNLDVDDLRLSKAGKRRVLEVIVDGDAPVDLDLIAQVSRAVSESLDSSNVMGQTPYVLEVSSRGVGRPLTKAAHWRRNVGRLVHIVGADFDITGRIVQFNEPQVVLEVQDVQQVIDIATITNASIEVEFNRSDDQNFNGFGRQDEDLELGEADEQEDGQA